MTGSPHRLLLLLLAAAAAGLLLRCGAQEQRPATPPRPAAPCTRLLSGPLSAGVAWEIDSPWHRAALPTDHPEAGIPPLLHCDFEGDGSVASAGWLAHASFRDFLPASTAPSQPPRIRDGSLELRGRNCVAARIVPIVPLSPVVMLLHIRPPADASSEVRLLVFDLTEDPSSLRDPVAIAERIVKGGIVATQRAIAGAAAAREAADRMRYRIPEVIRRDADGFETWRVEFTTEWSARALLLVLLGSESGSEPLAIDDLSLRLLPARTLLGLPPGELSSLCFDLPRPWENVDPKLRAAKVRCDWESRRALLLTRGAVARCRFPRPRGAGALELGFAIVREDRLTAAGPDRERVHVRVGGATRDVDLELRASSPSGWSDVTLPIAAFAAGDDETLELELRVDGEDSATGPLLAVSDPLLYARPPDAAPAAGAPRNLVVISLDTLRADRLGRKVRGKSVTPNLDRLAARSIVCSTALSNSSYTLPSHVSMFTSQRPGEHGVLTVFDAFSAQRSANLATIAAEHGFATAAFTSGGMLNAEFCGIDTGFDRFGEIDALLSPDDRLRRSAPLRERGGYNRELAAMNRLDRAPLPWLAGHRGVPFLFFLHTYLVHNYQPEPELLAEFTRDLPPTPFKLTGSVPYRRFLSDASLAAQGHGDERFEFVGDGPHEFVAARDLPWVEAQYDATVAQADRDVGRILAELDRLGLSERTIVVVTSDHGEEFLEHGDLGHARTLYDEILRVPLIVHVPGMEPRKIDDPIELIDLAPTLLAQLGLPTDPRMRGNDLLAAGFEPRDVTIHEGIEVGGSPDRTLRAARARSGKLVILSKLTPHAPGFVSDNAQQQLNALGYFELPTLQDVGEKESGSALRTGFFDLQRDPRETIDLHASDLLNAVQRSQMAALSRALLEAPLRRGTGEVTRRDGPGAIAAALVCALGCIAIVAVAVARERRGDRQQVVRLLERCLADDSRFQWSAAPSVGELVAPLQRWRFRGHRANWLLLDETGRPVAANDRAAAAWTPRKLAAQADPAGGQSDDLLRFPTARGALALVVPASAQRLLRVTARVRRAPPAASLAADHESRQAALVVQPLLAGVDLAAELARRDYAALVNDPHVRISVDDLWAGAPAPASGRFETISLTFLTPGLTQALLLQFSAGDGSAGTPVDLDEIVLEEWSLRGFFGLGAPAREPSPLALTAPIDGRDLALLPAPDPRRPALRKVDDLLERRDALVLPPPASASFEVDLPDGDLVLEYGVARVHEARRAWGRAAIEVTLSVEPALGPGPRLEQADTLDGDATTGWKDRTLDLERLAARRVRITFTASARNSLDLVAIGAPLVRRRAPLDPRRNVVVISLDTVRADHLSCQGYPRPTTPQLDDLARDCAWFRDVSSTSSYTLPAHASLLTGQLPSRHGAESERAGRNHLWSDRSDLLAVRLRDEGWLTAAFTGGVYLAPGFGFDQGFDRYDTTDLLLQPDDPRAMTLPRAGDAAFNARYRKGRTLDHALDWIRAHADGRFLLFLHTYLVHDYLADARHDARFHGSCASALARTDLGFVRDRKLTAKPTATDLDHYVDAYDAALNQADEEIGRVLATLRELGLLDSTILVVTSDHGEEFGDHGGVNHGRTLNEEVVRVPLLLRAPGAAPREVRTPVSLVDVTPTLLDLLGLAPEHELDGRSLAPLLRGGELAPVALQAELNLARENRWAMRRLGDDKAIGVSDERSDAVLAELGATRGAARRSVFAPPLDPRETLDLAQEGGEAAAAAAEQFDELDRQRDAMRERRAAAKRTASGEHHSSDPFELRGVGYVEPPSEDDD